jgi:transcriptional regulator with XRE-family HTH domain
VLVESSLKKFDLPSDGYSVVVAGSVTSGVKNPLWFGLPNRLIELRAAANLRQHIAPTLSGLSISAGRHIETGRSIPNIETVAHLAAGLGVSPTWLAFGWDGFQPFRQRVPRKGETPRSDPTPDPAQRDPSQDYKAISQRLRQARDAEGLSLRAIARGCELSPQALSLIESGRSIPLVSNVEAIALVLGVSPGWLAFGEIDEYE